MNSLKRLSESNALGSNYTEIVSLGKESKVKSDISDIIVVLTIKYFYFSKRHEKHDKTYRIDQQFFVRDFVYEVRMIYSIYLHKQLLIYNKFIRRRPPSKPTSFSSLFFGSDSSSVHMFNPNEGNLLVDRLPR